MTARRPAATFTAFVLHRWDWSETSLILDLFTREAGRVVVAAKGAKRPYSQLRPVLLPFQCVLVQLSRAAQEAEVQTLRSAEWAGGAPMLSGAALLSGFYLNELLMKLLARGDPHALLFDAYVQTLPALAVGDESMSQGALRAFELVLLREIGLLPDLGSVTLTREALAPSSRYAIVPEGGVILAQGDESPAWLGDTLLALQCAFESGDLQALVRVCTQRPAGLKPVLRHLLHYHLGSPTLRTREVMRDVQRVLNSPRTLSSSTHR